MFAAEFLSVESDENLCCANSLIPPICSTNWTSPEFFIFSITLTLDLWSKLLNDFLKEKILIWCKKLDVEFYNVYGLTEFGSWVSGSLIKDQSDNSGCVGNLWDLHIKIDEYKQIYLNGESQMVGYIQNKNLIQVPPNEWIATGDLGYLDEINRLNLIGRNSLAINRNGIKISPEEIENKILQHPGINEVCVLGKNKRITGEVPIAIIVLKKEFFFDESPELHLHKWLSTHLIEYKLPYRWIFVENLPYNERGKLNRNLIYDLYLKKLDL